MNIVSNPMHNGKDFEGRAQKEKEEGDGSRMCLNDSFETELGCRHDHPEEGGRGVGKAKKEAKEKEEEESKVEEGKVDKEEMKKEEEEEEEEMKEEKMFADSCVQTGPPSFRMVRFKQEPAGQTGIR